MRCPAPLRSVEMTFEASTVVMPKAISIGAYTYALSQIDQKEAKEA